MHSISNLFNIRDIGHKVGYGASSLVKDLGSKVGLGSDMDLNYTIEVDEEGHIENCTAYFEGKPVPEEAKKYFNAAFSMWLETKGYEIDTSDPNAEQPQIIDSATRAPITQEKFTELLENQDKTGFNHFINLKMTGIEAHAQPGLR